MGTSPEGDDVMVKSPQREAVMTERAREHGIDRICQKPIRVEDLRELTEEYNKLAFREKILGDEGI